MKSLFLAALAAFAFFSSAPASAQQYRDTYYRDSRHSSHSDAAYVLGALIEVAAHNSHNRRSNYYGGNRYYRDRHYGQNRHYDRYTYTPRYRSYRHHNRYNSYPVYRGRHHYQGHHGYRSRHHRRGH